MDGFRFNKSDYSFILIYFLVGSLWLIFRWNIENYTLFEILTGLPAVIIKNVLLLYIFKWLINKFLVKEKNYITFMILAFVALEAVGFLDMLRDYYTSNHPWELPSIGDMLVQNFYRGVLDTVLLLGLLSAKKYYENKLDYIKLQNSQKELELKVLRSQYDPHFLYNSLNTIDALVDYSPKEKVKEYISHLASLYRYLIHSKDEDIATLEDEISLARNYFYLIETRFGNDYSFEIIEQEKPKANYLPNGALLTVLENVVKHNKSLDGNTILTTISVEKDSVKIVNLISKSESRGESTETGLVSLNKRYQLLSDHKIKMEETKQNFTVWLPLLNLVN